ncbi:hypothetical protein Ahia01_000305700, partial [Argonauta hians]
PSSRWHLNYSVCDSCYQQRNKGLSCPLCGKAYRHFTQKTMLQCKICQKFVHAECVETVDSTFSLQFKENECQTDYVCTLCRNRDSEMCIVPSIQSQDEIFEELSAKGSLILPISCNTCLHLFESI